MQLDDEYIWVETAIKSTCKTCSAKSNCGTSTIAEAFAGKSVINKVKNSLNATLDDQVEIGIPEERLIEGAFWVYILPILTALFTCLVAQYWLSRFIQVSEWMIIIATLLGGALGFLFAKKRLSNDDDDKYQPELLKVFPTTIHISAV